MNTPEHTSHIAFTVVEANEPEIRLFEISGDGVSVARQDKARLKCNPHMHRRTFATVAMEAGVLEEIVDRLLNHTPLSITGLRYARPSLDALRPSLEVKCTEVLRRIEN